MKNPWILRKACEKLSRERATWGAHDWKLKSRARLSFSQVSRGKALLARKSRNILPGGFLGETFIPFTHTIYTLIIHKCKRDNSERKTLDRFSTTCTPFFKRESYLSLVRIYCSLFSFPLPLSYVEKIFVPKHNPHIFRM